MKKICVFITMALVLGVAPYAAAGPIVVAGHGGDPADVHTPECADVQAQARDAAGDLDAAVPWDGYNRRLVKARKVVKRALWKREITRDCASCIEASFIHNVHVEEQDTCGPTVVCPCDAAYLDSNDYPSAICFAGHITDPRPEDMILLEDNDVKSFAVASVSWNVSAIVTYFSAEGQLLCEKSDITSSEVMACANDIVEFAENVLNTECPPLPDFEPPPP